MPDPLTPRERAMVEEAARRFPIDLDGPTPSTTADLKVAAFRMHADGIGPKEIGRRLGIKGGAVSEWIRAFRRRGGQLAYLTGKTGVKLGRRRSALAKSSSLD
jgi:transposase-like protein